MKFGNSFDLTWRNELQKMMEEVVKLRQEVEALKDKKKEKSLLSQEKESSSKM